jgi:hypothetical protein
MPVVIGLGSVTPMQTFLDAKSIAVEKMLPA